MQMQLQLHYITQHYATLITLHYITLRYITFATATAKHHYIALHYTTLITLHRSYNYNCNYTTLR